MVLAVAGDFVGIGIGDPELEGFRHEENGLDIRVHGDRFFHKIPRGLAGNFAVFFFDAFDQLFVALISRDDDGVGNWIRSAVMFLSRFDDVEFRAGGADGGWQAQFDYAADAAAGLRARKIFAIDAKRPYVIKVTATVTLDGAPLATALRWGPALGSGKHGHARGVSRAA